LCGFCAGRILITYVAAQVYMYTITAQNTVYYTGSSLIYNPRCTLGSYKYGNPDLPLVSLAYIGDISFIRHFTQTSSKFISLFCLFENQSKVSLLLLSGNLGVSAIM